MKKDIEWLKKEIGELPCVDTVFNSGGSSYIDSAVPVMAVYDLIDKLDEPEVLSEEWIDDKTFVVTDSDGDDYAVVGHASLKNLIIPKQESQVLSQENINLVLDDLKEYIKEQQLLSQNVGLAHTSAGNDTHYRQYDYALECIDEYEPSDDLQNLLVPKRELPVIPQWVADSIESKKKVGTRLNVAMSEFPEYKLEQELGIDEHECNELYARSWLDGYTIASEEEEPLYRVSARDMTSGFWFLCKDNDGEIEIGTNKDYYEADWDSLKLTEQEIRDYDPRYMAFAEPVEEMEE